MSDSSQRWSAADVLPWVYVFARHLAPGCERVVVAGSLRRKKAEVGDVELVVLPRRDVDLYGEPAETYSALDHLIRQWVERGHVRLTVDGPRQKRLEVTTAWPGLKVELYIADWRNFGGTLAIRTGSAEFSKALVTPQPFGLMPEWLRQEGGYLRSGSDGTIIPCQTEQDYFTRLGVQWVEPEHRTGETPDRMRQGAAVGGGVGR